MNFTTWGLDRRMLEHTAEEILRLEDVVVDFHLHKGILTAVNSVSFALHRREAMGIVGESGCGKSVTAMSIMGLNPSPPAQTRGRIIFEGENLLTKTPKEMREVRGDQIGMIFQEPMTSLNPVFTVGDQIIMGIQSHREISAREARDLAIDMLAKVGIPGPSERINNYPHEFSGGMRQRVMLALALVLSPTLLIADEPTTALDVSVQAQILNLLDDLISTMGMSLIFISHDLNVVADICDRIGVMYMANLVEVAGTDDIFDSPLHPYTRGLMECSPVIGHKVPRLESIRGAIGNMLQPPGGCRFHPRCPEMKPICTRETPLLKEIAPGHFVACHL